MSLLKYYVIWDDLFTSKRNKGQKYGVFSKYETLDDCLTCSIVEVDTSVSRRSIGQESGRDFTYH